MIWLIAALIAVSFILSLPMTAIMRAVGRRTGAMDSAGVSGQVKAQVRRVPNTGGVAIFLGIAIPLAAALAGVHLLSAESLAGLPLAEPLLEHLPGIKSQSPLALTFLICLTLLHIMGIVDDRKPLGPWLKLLVMLAPAAAIVWVSKTHLLEMLDPHVGGPWLSFVITVAWMVAITNAMNFMDNMDGLSAGVTAIAGACFLIATLLSGQWFIAAMLALLIGAALGFLVFNFPPASIFMGDGGSLVLGFTLAFLTVQTTYYGDENGIAVAGGWYAVFMPVVILAVPIYDFGSVLVIRLAQGKNPFVGDLQHFSHRLNRRGLSVRSTALVIYGFTAATGISGISLASLEPWQALLVGIQTVLILAVLAAFEHASRDKPTTEEQ